MVRNTMMEDIKKIILSKMCGLKSLTKAYKKDGKTQEKSQK
jgi:hypothetical protein